MNTELTTELTTDFDGAWKEALEQFFPAFIEFFWPQAYAAIDWAKPYAFLDRELRQITRDAAVGECARLTSWRVSGAKMAVRRGSSCTSRSRANLESTSLNACMSTTIVSTIAIGGVWPAWPF